MKQGPIDIDGLHGIIDRFDHVLLDQWGTLHEGQAIFPAALDCVVEEAIERHSHAIVIGHVRSVLTAPGSAGLAYWDGRYAAIDNGADARKLAEVSLPTMRGLWEI